MAMITVVEAHDQNKSRVNTANLLCISHEDPCKPIDSEDSHEIPGYALVNRSFARASAACPES